MEDGNGGGWGGADEEGGDGEGFERHEVGVAGVASFEGRYGPPDVAVVPSPSPISTAAFDLLHLRSNFNSALSSFSSCSCSLALPTFFSVYLNFVVHSLISLSLYGLNLGFIPVGGWGLSFGFQSGVNGLYIDELMCGYDNDTIYIIKQPAH